MSDIKISLDSSGPRGEISVVRVDGVIDTMTSTDLEKVMNSLMERQRHKIIVDLGGVDYISSAGWGIFISNIREIRQHAGDIKLARMIPNVYEIFELLEFDSILKAFDSVEKAKTDFDSVKKPGESESLVLDRGMEKPDASSIPHLPDRPPSHTAASTVDKAPEKSKDPDSGGTSSTLAENIVLEMISKDPFLSISEIKKETTKKNPSLKVGWWRIWNILRHQGLLSKKSRFRKAKLKGGTG
jgi:anti-sigma B factor antagonist